MYMHIYKYTYISLTCPSLSPSLSLTQVTSLLIFRVLKRYARNRVHQAKTGENNVENNSGS